MSGNTRSIIAGFVVCLSGILSSCNNDSTGVRDSAPPSPIVDLVVGRPLGNTLTAAWTATGDDSTEGHATYYDLRFSKEPLSDRNWPGATRYANPSRPFAAGVYQGCQVVGLEPSTLYFVAVKAADEAYNWSSISNIGSAITTGFSDSIPPSAISDLSLDSATSFTIGLSWTSVGDDATTGQASVYDVRFSVAPILTDADWGFAAQLIGEPAPLASGNRQSLTVTGLVPNRQFYFAIRAGDEIINWSQLSGQIIGRTQPAEAVPPATITDLRVFPADPSSVQLIWTATGDDGNLGLARSYDVRYSSFPINEETWGNCAFAVNEPDPGPPGTEQSMIVTNLDPFRWYNFAIRVSDEIPNWSAVSNVVTAMTTEGSTLIDTLPPSRVSDLTVIASSQSAITLRWRCVGDDYFAGNAVAHDLRYALDSITDNSWSVATQVTYAPPPVRSGNFITMDVKNLTAGTLYYFAIKTSDDTPNWSVLSNIAHGMTRP